MKKNIHLAMIVGAILLVSLLLFTMTYSVRFSEVAIVTTFGRAADESSVQVEPGLHFKWPAPIQAAKSHDRRLQLVDSRLETQATQDGLQVIVQAFVTWKIDDSPAGVLQFERAFGSVDRARSEIEARMRSAIAAVSEFRFDELTGRDNRLADAETKIRERLIAAGSNTSLAGLGVSVEQVGLSQVILPPETTKSVIQRMENERKLRAETERDTGASQAAQLQAEASEKRDKILAYANRLANEIRAKGDMLSEDSVRAMSVDPDFAVLLLWIDALEETTYGTSTFFLPTTVAPWHLLDFSEYSGGIPRPAGEFPLGPAGGDRTIAGSSTPGGEGAETGRDSSEGG